MRIPLSALSLACCLTAAAQAQAVHYVDAQLTTGAGDGSSWSDAFQGPLGLQAALAQIASTRIVYVADGTYFATDDLDPSKSFDIPPGAQVFGGFLGDEPNPFFRRPFGQAPTILSGDLLQNDGLGHSNMADNTQRIVRVLEDGFATRLDGFTIRGGRAVSGGGLYVEAALTAANCRFEGCFADDRGGAAFCFEGDLNLEDSVFTGNLVSFIGGGAVSYYRAQGLVNRCVFEGNRVNIQGGAILSEASDLLVSNSVFSGNRGSLGAAIYAEHLVSNPPSSSLTVVASTFFGNQVDDPAQSVVGVFDPANAIVSISRSIFWGNDYDLILGRDVSLGIEVSDSIVESGHPGTGISQSDPLFRDAGQGDFYPLPGSPAIDATDIAPLSAQVRYADVSGKRRSVDDPQTMNTGPGFMDLGAFETTTAIGGALPNCTSPPNSTGAMGLVDAYGSASIAVNSLTLAARNLPTNAFGFFIIGRTPGFIPNPGGQPGNLCLTTLIGRIVGPGQVVNSGSAGAYSVALDVTDIPQGPFFVAGQPGDTWYFQSWHRDIGAFGPSSQFTDLASFTLLP
ncbi:MAG: hypothetical protein ACJA0P_003914 [Planctomycetota bacterium]|jgi:hypothetical protein